MWPLHGHRGVLRWCVIPQERLQIQSSTCQNPDGFFDAGQMGKYLPQSQQRPVQRLFFVNSSNDVRSVVLEMDLTILDSESDAGSPQSTHIT